MAIIESKEVKKSKRPSPTESKESGSDGDDDGPKEVASGKDRTGETSQAEGVKEAEST